jgi:F-type H+-transporting ATPase subunit delta
VEIEDGIDVFEILASGIKSLPGIISGRLAAEKLEKQIRHEMKAFSESNSPSLELAVRFLILMVRKGMFRHVNLIIKEAKKLLNEKRRLIEVSLEYASPLLEESRIKEAIKKRTGATKVVLNSTHKPELIGGYKIKIGDEVIDASVRSQLEKLQITLQSEQISPAAVAGGY